MRLRTVLSIAVFVALAACDSKGPPKVGATAPQDQGAVTVPMTASAPKAACPSEEEIIAKACPPAKVAKAPAKPVKIHRHPPKKKPRVQVAAAPPPAPAAAPAREYARVEAPQVREYARVEAPPPPAPRAQARITEEEVYQSWRSGGAAPPAPPPMAFNPPPQMAYSPPPAVYSAAPRGPCCTYPAAGRDANGFLTWPGKR